MDIEKISSIIKLFNESNLKEMTVEYKDLKLTLKGYSSESNDDGIISTEVKTSKNINISSENNTSVLKNDSLSENIDSTEKNGEWIKSPFVGTYYSAASENSSPYVSVGQLVKEGDTLCIIEAMKVMNEIKSNKSGKILEIKHQDGELVQYDEKIFLIGDEND